MMMMSLATVSKLMRQTAAKNKHSTTVHRHEGLPGLYWTLGSGASACHAEPIPLFAMKLARGPSVSRPAHSSPYWSHSLGSGEKRNPF